MSTQSNIAITLPGPFEPAYTIRVTRTCHGQRDQSVEFEDYGILRELLDDIQRHPEIRAWLEESDEP